MTRGRVRGTTGSAHHPAHHPSSPACPAPGARGRPPCRLHGAGPFGIQIRALVAPAVVGVSSAHAPVHADSSFRALDIASSAPRPRGRLGSSSVLRPHHPRHTPAHHPAGTLRQSEHHHPGDGEGERHHRECNLPSCFHNDPSFRASSCDKGTNRSCGQCGIAVCKLWGSRRPPGADAPDVRTVVLSRAWR